MQTQILSSLAKVFPDEKPVDEQISGFSMLKNERKSFQLAFCSDIDKDISIEIKSPLKGQISVFSVGLVPAQVAKYDNSDDFILRNGRPGLYPDPLFPITGKIAAKTTGQWQSLWFELEPDGKFIGDQKIEILLNGQPAGKITVNIINAALPEQELMCTFWFHTDSLMHWYGCDAFSEEYWRAVENYAACAVRHGINMLLTPLFTLPLDTAVGGERPTHQLVDVEKTGENYTFGFRKLERWIDVCDRVGVKYIEFSHLFTQWGAKHAPKIMANVDGEYRRVFGWDTKANSREYREFLTQFAAALLKFIDRRGIHKRCVFHVSDEPERRHYRSFKRAAQLIRQLFAGFKIIDALSDYKFYKKGLVSIPVVTNNHAHVFWEKAAKRTELERWVYYCCNQRTDYVSNHFLAMPSQRNRIIGWQIYKFGVKGFLHWGYNFWAMQFSKGFVNPFEVTDAGGGFAAGDSFVVYPGADFLPLSSINLKVFHEALQDMRAMCLLENKIGKDAVIALIERDTRKPLSFTEYPHDEAWMLAAREMVNEAIMQQCEYEKEDR
ncbi:MAG: DUF4091 domain-containing protein [Oscillospiraceae bacterium]|nr:DUF4091 domain-containing protein [Oscillospiraceae bacterium]